jgi:hypothetical protein
MLASACGLHFKVRRLAMSSLGRDRCLVISTRIEVLRHLLAPYRLIRI